jgi:hypothetical protein
MSWIDLTRIAARVADGWSLQGQAENLGLKWLMYEHLNKDDEEALATWLDKYEEGKPVAKDHNAKKGEYPLPKGTMLVNSALVNGLPGMAEAYGILYDVDQDLSEVDEEKFKQWLWDNGSKGESERNRST